MSFDGTMTSDRIRDTFNPTKLDLVIALIASILLPIAAGSLFDFTGALIPMAMYYGLFAVAIVKWRKGSLDYQIRKDAWRTQFRAYLTPLFFVLFLLQSVLVLSSWFTLNRVEPVEPSGWILTLIIWAPINAFAEQLIWLYTFDSFAEYFKEGVMRKVLTVIGGILYLTLIGLIHAFFWGKFLLGSEYMFPFTELFFVIQFIMPIGYIFLYRRTGSMWPIAIIHLFLNLTGILFSGYSILPYLVVIS